MHFRVYTLHTKPLCSPKSFLKGDYEEQFYRATLEASTNPCLNHVGPVVAPWYPLGQAMVNPHGLPRVMYTET